jgi:hypothetical protein
MSDTVHIEQNEKWKAQKWRWVVVEHTDGQAVVAHGPFVNRADAEAFRATLDAADKPNAVPIHWLPGEET